VLGSDGKGDREHFASVEPSLTLTNPYAWPYERFTIYMCRGMTMDLKTLWPKIKKWK